MVFTFTPLLQSNITLIERHVMMKLFIFFRIGGHQVILWTFICIVYSSSMQIECRNGSIRCLAMSMFQSVSGACAWDNVSSQVLNPIIVPIFKEFFLRCHRHIYIQAPKGTRTWGGIQNQVAENKIDYCTSLHKFFKVSLPYWSLNAHQPRAEYEFGSQVIKLIVVPILYNISFLQEFFFRCHC